MKTLVIHPDDRSTDFLKIIYENKDWTILSDRLDIQMKMVSLIKEHDRIIMMGHGCPYGLLGFTTQFINPKFIDLLRTKDCVCIWCNADKYVENVGLRGFYTGMFISEVGEASYFGIDVDQETVDYSNNLFVHLMKDAIDSPTCINEIKWGYNNDSNPVIKFNHQRLYYKAENTPIGYHYEPMRIF